VKEQLYPYRHKLIAFGVPLVVGFILYLLVINPQLGRMADLEFQIMEKQDFIQKQKHLLKNEKQYRQDAGQAKKELEKYESQLHGFGAGEDLVNFTLKTAKENNIKVTGLEAGKTRSGEVFNEIALKAETEGGFASQVRFLFSLETHSPPFRIDGLSLRADNKGVLKGNLMIYALVKNAPSPVLEGDAKSK
jgi:hypothetical protein